MKTKVRSEEGRGGTSRRKDRKRETASRGTRASKAVRGKKKTGKKRSSSSSARNILDQTKSQNSLSMWLAFMVVVILVIIVAVNSVALRRRLNENHQRAEMLRKEIQTENQRTADIEEYRRYTGTDAYIEEVAREKLGLIYEGEMVFKEEK